MAKEGLHTVWSKGKKMPQNLINKDPVRKSSMAVLTAQISLAEDAIKNGTAMERVSGVINHASFTTKDCISYYIDHINGEGIVDKGFVLRTLHMTMPSSCQ